MQFMRDLGNNSPEAFVGKSLSKTIHSQGHNAKHVISCKALLVSGRNHKPYEYTIGDKYCTYLEMRY